MGRTAIEPERLTFNRTTLETKVWKRGQAPGGAKPLKTYTPASIPRHVFDVLPLACQIPVLTARQRVGVGWRETDGAWQSYKIGERSPCEELRATASPSSNGTPRARGAGRPKAQAARSSARSGDSGEDGEPSSPSDGDGSEPPLRRLCAFCGKDIPPARSPKATHCTNQHADRDRQRRKRQRERERSKLPPTATTADLRRMFDLTDEDRARLRELVVCRCNGGHLELEPGRCSKCGRWLPRELADGLARYAAFVRRVHRVAA